MAWFRRRVLGPSRWDVDNWMLSEWDDNEEEEVIPWWQDNAAEWFDYRTNRENPHNWWEAEFRQGGRCSCGQDDCPYR